MTRTPLSAETHCTIIPPYLLEAMVGSDRREVVDAARRTLDRDQVMRERRTVAAERGPGSPDGFLPGAGLPGAMVKRPRPHKPATPPPAVLQRAIHDAKQTTTLPGALVRAEGAPPDGDLAVTQAYDGLGATWQLLNTAYGRNSLDDRGLPLVATVHYDRAYDNAFWDGAQMVFGDGDGTYFNGFTSSIDVIGHELAHGMTQYTAGLTYVAQSGALNESVSDCFGSMVKQLTLGQSATEADWLIGAGLFTKKVKGTALRSMKAPGTAYDDPVLGKDPQPADMGGFVDLPHDASHDNGGVHTNSGIPNRAFYLAATGIGGHAWEGAGQVWYDVLTGKDIAKDVTFADFADLTVAAARTRFGATSPKAKSVHDAWVTVKVLT
ncbi:M4 family metallopeptidase [Lapillicoccus sp.]|uniref:M4 family metallopeptidase n=1 Tax=Lapillicoccus sp. TaxID=1909287 RepID=UPI00398388A7